MQHSKQENISLFNVYRVGSEDMYLRVIGTSTPLI